MSNKEILIILNDMVKYNIITICGDIEETYYILNNSYVLNNYNTLAIIKDNNIIINDITINFINENMINLINSKVQQFKELNNKLFNNKKIDLLLNLASNQGAAHGEKINCIQLVENMLIKLINNKK